MVDTAVGKGKGVIKGGKKIIGKKSYVDLRRSTPTSTFTLSSLQFLEEEKAAAFTNCNCNYKSSINIFSSSLYPKLFAEQTDLRYLLLTLNFQLYHLIYIYSNLSSIIVYTHTFYFLLFIAFIMK